MKLLILAALFAGAAARAGEPAAIRITPAQIAVGAFYGGADVTIQGAVALSSDAIVTITGSDREERFNRKARVGPIWVAAGRLRISGVPSLFLRFSSRPVKALLDADAAASLRLDARSLQTIMRIDPRVQGGDDAIRRDYLALKRADGVYSFSDAGIEMGRPGVQTPFTLRFRWPKKAPPGAYVVHLYEIRGGAVARESSRPFSVVRVGVPAWLAGLAENRASMYGITAVLVGALAGFGIDFLTTTLLGRKKRAAAH